MKNPNLVTRRNRQIRLGDLRVIDESGDDHLFSADRFVCVDVPARVKASLLKAPERRLHTGRKR